MSFQDIPLKDTISFLSSRARELDPTGKGIKIVLAEGSESEPKRLPLNLREVPMRDTLQYIAALSGLEVLPSEGQAFLVPAGE